MADLLGEAWVRVRADNKMLKPGLKQAEDETRKSMNRIASFSGSIKGAIAGIAITATLANEYREATKAASDQFEADKRLEGALKATGHAAGLSAEELKAYASAMQNSTGIADDEIQNFMAVLLTFRNVQGDTFLRATSLAADMATIMGTDVSSAAVQLGKALNDPIKGIMALNRVGVQFSDSQKKMIKDFVKSGQGAKAQAVILDELANQFGGAAEVMAGGEQGGIKLLKAQLGEAREALGAILVPLQEVFVKFQITFTRILTVVAPVFVELTRYVFDFFIEAMSWGATFINHWDEVWGTIKSVTYAYTLAARDYFFGFINFALESLNQFASDSVKIFTMLPELIKAAMEGGSLGVLNVLDREFKKSLEKMAQNFAEAMVLSPEAKDAFIKSAADVTDLLAKQQKIKDSVFKPEAGQQGPFARPKAGKQDFSGGEAKSKAAEAMTGFFGIEDFTKRIQESLLKVDNSAKLVALGEQQKNLQQQMLDEQKKANAKPALPVATP